MVRVTLYCSTYGQSIDLVIASVVTVGRGFLQCHDKRVSRNHGTITVAEATISVKSCHTNPIFYKLNGQQQTKILAKDSEVTLKHQDKFSLLPNEFEYEVRVIEEVDEAPIPTDEPASARTSIQADSTIAGSPSADVRKRSHQEDQADNTAKRVKIKPDPDQAPPSAGTSKISSSGATSPVPEVKVKTEPLPHVTARPPADTSGISSSGAASTVPEVKVKTEPLPHATARPPADSTGVSSSGATSTVPEVKVKTEPAQPTPVIAPEPIRPSCNFGIRCYLNSPEHRRSHAHPSDADYRRPVYPDPPPDTPPCPFGASCYRRNPDHFMRLSHPPATQFVALQPPPAAQPQLPVNVFFVPVDDGGDSNDSEILGDFDDSLDDEDFEPDFVVESEESGIEEADNDSDDPDHCEE